MKENIHPPYHKLKLVISDDVFETHSTLSVGEILMDVDYRKHPAWTKDSHNLVNQSNKNVSEFNRRFSGITFSKNK